MVHELTMEADRRLARLELPELELELTEETVLMVEIGDMVEVRPLRELSPLSLLLWWWWLEEGAADSFQCSSCVCLGDLFSPSGLVNPLEMGLPPQLSTTEEEARLLSESRLFFQGDELAEAETLRRWWLGLFEAAAAEDGEAMRCCG